MDADERLTALQKAYADMILNTEKEAAARIMVSESKAVRFEYELKHAKEDAIQMLLRLKQMVDCKTSEAAVASCTQEKKIEELESQLQEAEDIVKDLREELRAVEAELERFSQIKELKRTVQVDNAPTREVQQPSSYTDQMDKSQKIFNSIFPFKTSLIANGDLPSIILRSKETELYRNGCTQRIRACENTTPDKNSSFSLKTKDINKNINPKLIVKEDIPIDENLVRMCNSQSTSGEEVTPVRQEKDEVDPPESKVCETMEVPSQPLTARVIKYTFQRKRKRGSLIGGSGSSEGNLIGESTPEKTRLEQVACQLVSLSDNKWQ